MPPRRPPAVRRPPPPVRSCGTGPRTPPPVAAAKARRAGPRPPGRSGGRRARRRQPLAEQQAQGRGRRDEIGEAPGDLAGQPASSASLDSDAPAVSTTVTSGRSSSVAMRMPRRAARRPAGPSGAAAAGGAGPGRGGCRGGAEADQGQEHPGVHLPGGRPAQRRHLLRGHLEQGPHPRTVGAPGAPDRLGDRGHLDVVGGGRLGGLGELAGGAQHLQDAGGHLGDPIGRHHRVDQALA